MSRDLTPPTTAMIRVSFGRRLSPEAKSLSSCMSRQGRRRTRISKSAGSITGIAISPVWTNQPGINQEPAISTWSARRAMPGAIKSARWHVIPSTARDYARGSWSTIPILISRRISSAPFIAAWMPVTPGPACFTGITSPPTAVITAAARWRIIKPELSTEPDGPTVISS